MKPTKEEALDYIRKRYPDQQEIHHDYLKPREIVVIKASGGGVLMKSAKFLLTQHIS